MGDVANNSFDDFWRELEEEVAAKGPKAVERFRQMQHRFRRGGELSMLRHARGWTQVQLSAASGIGQAEISRIERGLGNPTEETLNALAKQFGAHLAIVPDRELVSPENPSRCAWTDRTTEQRPSRT